MTSDAEGIKIKKKVYHEKFKSYSNKNTKYIRIEDEKLYPHEVEFFNANPKGEIEAEIINGSSPSQRLICDCDYDWISVRKYYTHKKDKMYKVLTLRIKSIDKIGTLKLDKSQCKYCIYHAKVNNEIGIYCNYLSLVGHSRGCEPSPKCTVYIKETRRRKRLEEVEKFEN